VISTPEKRRADSLEVKKAAVVAASVAARLFYQWMMHPWAAANGGKVKIVCNLS